MQPTSLEFTTGEKSWNSKSDVPCNEKSNCFEDMVNLYSLREDI